MKAEKYTGWFETGNGVLHFEQTATGITDLYVALSIIEKHYEFGHTDMEIYDGKGNDVTKLAYNIIQSIELSRAELTTRRTNNDDA